MKGSKIISILPAFTWLGVSPDLVKRKKIPPVSNAT
jgi:hypothetical protein